MTRVHGAHFTAIHVAQQTRKEARAADHAYLTTPAERWQGAIVNTDAIGADGCRATVSTIQRPDPADCRTDRPSPAVPSVAAVGAPRNATGADAPTSNGGAASLGLAASAAGAPLYALVHYCRAAGLPEPVPEYRFHPTRMWRFDYAFPLHKIAVEVDGAVWTQGRHTRGAGYIADMEKMNAAAKLGWRVLKYTPQTLGVAIDDLRVVLAEVEGT